jgi:hypothetical protein
MFDLVRISLSPSRRAQSTVGALLPALVASFIVGNARPASAQAVSVVSRESVATVALPARAARTDIRRVAAGERATYDLRMTGHVVGSGSLEVLGDEKVNGYRTLHVALQIEGSLLLAHINDRFDSWMDFDGLFSRRFVQDQHELRSTRHKDYQLSPEQKTYREADRGETGDLTTNEPLDDISMLFYVRTLPLRVGDVDTIPRYFKSGHDVIVKVLRKERIEVPAGTFETIVVQPTITNAGGLFGKGGQAQVYFSDDSSRTLVMLRTHVPIIGSATLVLKDFHPAP